MIEHSWWPEEGASLALPGVTLLRFPDLPSMLAPWRIRRLETAAFGVDGFLGWGRKRPARLSAALARRRNRPFWTIEDGFLRSIGLGKDRAPAFSCVIDDLGVYYDAAAPSRLEELLAAPRTDGSGRAAALREAIVSRRLTKYNHLADRSPGLPRGGRKLLLVDQVAGDYSVPGALADASAFATMFGAALDVPDARVVLRMHPDVMAGRARGYFPAPPRDSRIVVCDAPVSPHALIDEVDEVWTISSQLGLDALMRGVPVRCFAAPFYAGWGLTRDTPATPAAAAALARRRAARAGCALSLDELVDAALLRYPLYFDPIRGALTSPERVVERLAAGRDHVDAWRGRTLCAGLSWHKRRVLRAFCAPPGGEVAFSDRGGAGPFDRVVVWGARGEQALARREESAPTGRSAPLLRAEDGFIRSVGLGSAKTFPLSLCFDFRGLYYDATRSSDLEHLLETADVAPAELRRARDLRERLVAAGVSKYNLAAAPVRSLPEGRARIVVFGQVPDDESIRLGADAAIGNLDFLRAVRAERPDAFIIFKEHPDLVSGGRVGATDLASAARLADRVATDGDALAWIEAADEVRVRTSLAGFEALLRGKPVVCHGAPFYAGWGLTQDRVVAPRRTRRRSLDELVALALLRYPLYLHPRLHIPMDAEDALALIEATRGDPSGY
jgi:capsular polysaccharide export protein